MYLLGEMTSGVDAKGFNAGFASTAGPVVVSSITSGTLSGSSGSIHHSTSYTSSQRDSFDKLLLLGPTASAGGCSSLSQLSISAANSPLPGATAPITNLTNIANITGNLNHHHHNQHTQQQQSAHNNSSGFAVSREVKENLLMAAITQMSGNQNVFGQVSPGSINTSMGFSLQSSPSSQQSGRSASFVVAQNNASNVKFGATSHGLKSSLTGNGNSLLLNVGAVGNGIISPVNQNSTTAFWTGNNSNNNVSMLHHHPHHNHHSNGTTSGQPSSGFTSNNLGGSLSSSPRSSTSSTSSSSNSSGSIVPFGTKQRNNSNHSSHSSASNHNSNHNNNHNYNNVNYGTNSMQHITLNACSIKSQPSPTFTSVVGNKCRSQSSAGQFNVLNSTSSIVTNGSSGCSALNTNSSSTTSAATTTLAPLSCINSGNSSRYKTELCRPFEESGFCKYSDKCQYAHGPAELRSLQRHPKYKTELCRTFHTTGFCPYGPRCHFIHNNDAPSGKTKDLLDALTSSSDVHHHSHHHQSTLSNVGSSSSSSSASSISSSGSSIASCSALSSCSSSPNIGSNGSMSLPMTPTSPTTSNDLALQLSASAVITPQMSPQSMSDSGAALPSPLACKLHFQLVALQQQKQQQRLMMNTSNGSNNNGNSRTGQPLTPQLSPQQLSPASLCKSDDVFYKYI